jgi:hypothetical protein
VAERRIALALAITVTDDGGFGGFGGVFLHAFPHVGFNLKSRQ